MEEELEVEEELKAGVSVRLRKNPLLDDGSLIPEVSARKAGVKETLSLLEGEMSKTEISQMFEHLKLYQEKILLLLRRGYDVKVLDLGTLNIKLKGKASSPAEAAALSDWTVRFTPTGKTLEAVKGLSVDVASIPNRAPLIESVTDLCRGEADGQVTAGQAARLSGLRLKLGNGEGDFIAFVPQDDAGRDIEEKPKWLFAERDKVFRNMPAELCFIAPAGLEAGTKYRIRVSSTYLTVNISRKEPLWGESGQLTVVSSGVEQEGTSSLQL